MFSFYLLFLCAPSLSSSFLWSIPLVFFKFSLLFSSFCQMPTFWTRQKTRRGHTDTVWTQQKTRQTHRDTLDTPENKADTPRHSGHTRKQGGHTATFWTHQKTRRTHRNSLDTLVLFSVVFSVVFRFSSFSRGQFNKETTTVVFLLNCRVHM